MRVQGMVKTTVLTNIKSLQKKLWNISR